MSDKTALKFGISKIFDWCARKLNLIWLHNKFLVFLVPLLLVLFFVDTLNYWFAGILLTQSYILFNKHFHDLVNQNLGSKFGIRLPGKTFSMIFLSTLGFVCCFVFYTATSTLSPVYPAEKPGLVVINNGRIMQGLEQPVSNPLEETASINPVVEVATPQNTPSTPILESSNTTTEPQQDQDTAVKNHSTTDLPQNQNSTNSSSSDLAVAPKPTTKNNLGSLNQNPAKPVLLIRKSKTNVCHLPSSKYYNGLKNYKTYKTLKECLASGAKSTSK